MVENGAQVTGYPLPIKHPVMAEAVSQDRARSREPDSWLGSKKLGLVIGEAGGTVLRRRAATSSAACHARQPRTFLEPAMPGANNVAETP